MWGVEVVLPPPLTSFGCVEDDDDDTGPAIDRLGGLPEAA